MSFKTENQRYISIIIFGLTHDESEEEMLSQSGSQFHVSAFHNIIVLIHTLNNLQTKLSVFKMQNKSWNIRPSMGV